LLALSRCYAHCSCAVLLRLFLTHEERAMAITKRNRDAFQTPLTHRQWIVRIDAHYFSVLKPSKFAECATRAERIVFRFRCNGIFQIASVPTLAKIFAFVAGT
jgi:hypothetical protein